MDALLDLASERIGDDEVGLVALDRLKVAPFQSPALLERLVSSVTWLHEEFDGM